MTLDLFQAPALAAHYPRTPVERHGCYWVKRDDLFEVAGVRGGKARTCWQLAQGAPGLVTAGSRSSPQVNIVAQIARHLGIPCRAHTPTGPLTPEVQAAQAAGAEIVQHRAGYNSVIRARAYADAKARGWREIPFGMECTAAVEATATQVGNLPAGPWRLVVPVGSGMSLAGILWGLRRAGSRLEVLGVVVGATPLRRLNEYAPPAWREMAELVPAGVPYERPVPGRLGDLVLDPIYEAKCLPHLLPCDMLWVVGIRQTALKEAR